MRVMLTIAYDGTNYVGWQIQHNGLSVQQVLDDALSEFFKQPIHVQGASRTDAGVHSLGNVAAFDVDTRMPAEKIAYGINQSLPRDIVVVDSREVDSDFHPRFGAKEKTYVYRIQNSDFPDPTRRLYTYHYRHYLDENRMRQAAGYLIGEHDFTSFSSIHAQTKTFVRTIYELSVERVADEIQIEITGDGFLYNMVRIIVGTLVQIGAGLMEVEDMHRILLARDRGEAGPTAPPQGLTLVQIVYEGGGI